MGCYIRFFIKLCIKTKEQVYMILIKYDLKYIQFYSNIFDKEFIKVLANETN